MGEKNEIEKKTTLKTRKKNRICMKSNRHLYQIWKLTTETDVLQTRKINESIAADGISMFFFFKYTRNTLYNFTAIKRIEI